ncbi:hypothetical protein EDC01DRAFT_643403 [Geopyxis carbonaria]|nr:hypothetical protein EDC01DRAFT_643403 [Geopyxis carbonaria]
MAFTCAAAAALRFGFGLLHVLRDLVRRSVRELPLFARCLALHRSCVPIIIIPHIHGGTACRIFLYPSVLFPSSRNHRKHLLLPISNFAGGQFFLRKFS